jgi:adenylate kinase
MTQPLSEQQVAILKVILNAKPELRNAILKNADKNLVCSICEIVLNILSGNIKLDDQQKKKLSKHKDLLRRVVKKTKGWKQKRTIIQKGGNFLIPLLAPIIGSLIAKIFE